MSLFYCFMLHPKMQQEGNYWCNELNNKVHAHDWCMEYYFYIYPPPYYVSFHGHSFRKKEFCQVCLRLATDSSCNVWGRGLTTCLVYGGPLLELFLKKWQSVCKVGVTERNYQLSSCFYYFFLLYPRVDNHFAFHFFCFEMHFLY